MELQEEVLAGVEMSLEKFVEVSYEKIVDGLLETLKEKIPGSVDDMFIEAAAPMLKPIAKELLLAQIEKISAKV